MSRQAFARFAAPAAFLAAVTIAVLLIRPAFEQGPRHPGRTAPAATTTRFGVPGHGHRKKQHSHVRRYTVQSGDTFSSIARKTGTSVARLERLNPGVDSTALHVGQRIRVK